MKAALIDDNESHRAIMSAMFSCIDTYPSHTIDLSSYDIIFIDYMLGEINGLFVAREIQRKRPEKKIYILTGYDLSCEFDVIHKNDIASIRKALEIDSLSNH